MAKSPADRANEYHAKFAERIVAGLEKGIAPWQKPWAPGERVLPCNFSGDRSYRGGDAMYLAMVALERGYSDPRWGGFRQIDEAGGHVRKGEKGAPVMHVEFNRLRTVRDGRGRPVLDRDGRPQTETAKRERPLVKLQYVWNVEQTDGLELKRLERVGAGWDGHERAEGVMRNSGVRVDHVAGDRAFYSVAQDRVVLPERGQFASQASYTHTALHELGHATGHPDRLNRPTLTNHEGFGSETYAREELRAEIAAMMTGERLGVGHEPRHGTAYVASWVKALRGNPREIREACVDAQRASDWLVARDRERVTEREKGAPEPEARGREDKAREGIQVAVPALPRAREAGGDLDPGDAPGMSAELANVLRAVGARGYEQGHVAGYYPLEREPWSSARESVGAFAGERTAAGVELRFVLERAHATGYTLGFDDRIGGRERVPARTAASPEVGNRGRALWEQLRQVQREHGGGAYVAGYDEGAAGRKARPQLRDLPGVVRGLDAAWDLMHDVRARGYERGHAEGVSGAMKRDVALKRADDAVSYSAVARFGKHNQTREAELARRSENRRAEAREQGREGRRDVGGLSR